MISKSIKTIFFISLISIMLISCGKKETAKSEFVGTLILGNDSLYVQVDEDTLAFPFSEIGAYDTINCDVASVMTIYSTLDTFVFSPESIHKDMNVISNDSVKIVTITYFKYGK